MRETRRICMIGSHAPDGTRYPSVNEGLAERFRRDGHSVLLASRRRRRMGKLLDIVRTLVSQRREYDLVCVDTYSTAALWYARIGGWLARFLGKNLVVVLRGGRLPEVAVTRPERLRGLLRRADRVVAPSSYLAREVGEQLDVAVRVIANPVQRELYPSRLRAEASPRIFWLRAFERTYRPDVAVRAAALLRERWPELRMVMAGPERDGALERCRTLAESLGVADRIEFPGLISKEEIRRLGEKSDIFLNTTSADNAPVSILEAMAMGLCIVSTRVGGIPDLLEDRRTALLVPSGDPEAVAAAVAELIESPELARRLSASVLEEVEEFSLEAAVDRWYSLFDELGPAETAR